MVSSLPILEIEFTKVVDVKLATMVNLKKEGKRKVDEKFKNKKKQGDWDFYI